MGIEPRPQRWEARVLPLCHRGPLQEAEKGKLNWDQLEEIEKTKNRFTQRLMQNQRVGDSATIQTSTHFNKGFCRAGNDHVANGVLFPVKKIDHPLTVFKKQKWQNY